MSAKTNTDLWARDVLPRAADVWARSARTKAKTQAIAAGIEVGTSQTDGNGKYWIEILNKAPEAAAYEFGSGLHRTRGVPDKYNIFPKNKQVLAFNWSPLEPLDNSPKFAGFTPDGRYMFHFVEHPGVKPEPHMKPALDESKVEMGKIIGKAFVVDVVYKSIKEMWHNG